MKFPPHLSARGARLPDVGQGSASGRNPLPGGERERVRGNQIKCSK